MRLNKIISITGEIDCITGICIGGASNELEIGGIDKEVIKNPITKEPYIPGSSLKGKMRSQLEKRYGMYVFDKKERKVTEKYDTPCSCGRKSCMVCVVFGAYKNVGAESAPTRMIIRDGSLTEDSRRMIREIPLNKGSFLESKTENIIVRNTGAANMPRTIERVPQGIKFGLEINLQIFQGDDEKKMLQFVKEGLDLIELSYLGGSGSRGYGKVKFICLEIKEHNVQEGNEKDITKEWLNDTI